MSEGVRPALTQEQWAEVRKYDFAVAMFDDDPLNGPLAGLDALGVAAVALRLAGPDGKPLFTRGDAQLIRAALSRWDGMADTDEGVECVGDRYPLEQRRSIADRLAALLPPEEPEP